MTTQISLIEEVTLKKALKLLDSLGFHYAVIDAAGQKYGTLEAKKPKQVKRTKPRKYPHGERANYVRPFVLGIAEGGKAMIPIGKFEMTEVQASAISMANGLWGENSVATTSNKETKELEIMRIL